MISKNDEVLLEIDGYGHSGEGIGHVDGYTLFVQGAIPGEQVRVRVVKAKKNYGYGKILSVEETSDARVEPVCPVARRCGGCELQHMSYEEQLRFKTGHVRECMERIGGVDGLLCPDGMTDSEPEMTKSSIPSEGVRMEVLSAFSCDAEPCRYRNKAQFPIGRDRSGRPVAGFYAARSHEIIPCEDCLLQDAKINRILMIIMDHVREVDKELADESMVYNEETHTGWLRHVYIRLGYATGQMMVCLVVNDRIGSDYEKKAGSRYRLTDLVTKIAREPGEKAVLLNENTKKTNVVPGEKYIQLTGLPYIEDRIGQLRFQIGPDSFYQVNPHITKKLYDKALEYAALNGRETVWDLYCGIGTISLSMARHAKQVIGVEIVPQAIGNAKENAKINQIENATFIPGAAEDVIDEAMADWGGIPLPDVVVVDPPRKGCDEKLITAIGKAAPDRIVYVSCDPATLARDIARLRPYGFELKKVCVVDQFWQTRHVETVVLLSHSI